MMVINADQDYMDMYYRDRRFIVSYKDNLYIVDNKNYRKLSENEVAVLSNWALAEVEPGKYVYEKIEQNSLPVIIRFPDKINKNISKKFPKEQKDNLIQFFRDRYLMKLTSYVIRNKMNESNLTFKELNRMVLKDMDCLQYDISGKKFFLMEGIDLEKIEKMILKYFKEMIDWYGYINLGRFKLKIKKGEFVIFKEKRLSEDREKKRLKIIVNRDLSLV